MNDAPYPAPQAESGGPAAIEPRITDFVRLGVLALFAYWSYTLVAPFLVIVIWAAILTVALYPCYRALRVALGGSRRLAAIMLTFISLGIIIGPLAAIALNFIEATHWVLAKIESGSLKIPAPSESVRAWPVMGEKLYEAWNLASSNLAGMIQRFEPTFMQAGGYVIGKAAGFGLDLIGFMASVIVAGFMFGHGEQLAASVGRVAERVGGDRGIGFMGLAGATIRSVATGVIGVALLQSFLVGVVLYLFQVPASGGLTFAVMILCIVQIGPAPVLLPIVIWAWITKDFTYALGLTLLLVPVAALDNVIKPILVSRGLSTPMLVILMGVIGGTLSYGLIGLFLGPIVLSVFYDLLIAWVKVAPARRDDGPPA
ncbi:AI-2E family transporter [Mycoplana rhizolycopersici]|uniref:AI-2E family transporter n=1 Tax=Mycoplana rhizolycopersici TaxID=2746702 RepID=A0ABX2QIK8_9HYPH|nr:AI-2E family transporter [Rhizobium rhizolycopersici]NVP57043.1 AI-2E family transporter [Rhizobium rhizolycopersici]